MSSTTVMLLIGIPFGVMAVLFVLTFFVMGIARRKGMESMNTPPVTHHVPPDLQHQVLQLTHKGKLIEAIKEVRQATSMGLKEAKDYCEAVRDGRIPPQQVTTGGMLSERVRAFKDTGDRASAIALVRAETGMNQDEATRFVDAID